MIYCFVFLHIAARRLIAAGTRDSTGDVRAIDVTTSLLATVARLGFGERVGAVGKRPEKLLELYDFEACPYCRKVREALTVLDLEAMIYPCPKGGTRFRDIVRKRGGKEQFPYLVDPNTAIAMYESDDINRYLFERYGSGGVPLMLSAGPLTLIGSLAASGVRFGRGERYQPSRLPEQPLELYSYEGSPFCRLVREVLCELALPYHLRNVAHGSSRRAEFTKRSGKMMVPYLVDPNRGVAMFESADTVAYLRRTYAVA
jgi:glutathione S-transferase